MDQILRKTTFREYAAINIFYTCAPGFKYADNTPIMNPNWYFLANYNSTYSFSIYNSQFLIQEPLIYF